MRKWIKIAEQLSPDMAEELRSWQEHAHHDEAFSDARHGWQQRLIDYAKEHPPKVSGMLYRASRCDDDVAEALIAGQAATHDKIGSKLESWAKTPLKAVDYAQYQRDQHSVIVMAIPAEQLTVICDIDNVEGYDQIEEDEVLILAERRQLSPQNVILVLHHDYDNGGVETIVYGDGLKNRIDHDPENYVHLLSLFR